MLEISEQNVIFISCLTEIWFELLCVTSFPPPGVWDAGRREGLFVHVIKINLRGQRRKGFLEGGSPISHLREVLVTPDGNARSQPIRHLHLEQLLQQIYQIRLEEVRNLQVPVSLLMARLNIHRILIW